MEHSSQGLFYHSGLALATESVLNYAGYNKTAAPLGVSKWNICPPPTMVTRVAIQEMNILIFKKWSFIWGGKKKFLSCLDFLDEVW